MKKNLVTTVLFTAAIFGSVFAQQNTIPSNGNVGLGTTNPNAKLDVNGRVKIDSTLVVKDSVTIESSMRVMGESTFEDARFNNVDVIGTFNAWGASQLNSDVFLPAVGATTGIDGKHFLITRNNGLIEKVDFPSLASTLGASIYESKTCTGGVIPNPTWANGP